MKTYNESMTDTLEEFKRRDYVDKLKAQTTSETIPSNDEDLLAFLYDQVMMHTWWYDIDIPHNICSCSHLLGQIKQISYQEESFFANLNFPHSMPLSVLSYAMPCMPK